MGRSRPNGPGRSARSFSSATCSPGRSRAYRRAWRCSWWRTTRSAAHSHRRSRPPWRSMPATTGSMGPCRPWARTRRCSAPCTTGSMESCLAIRVGPGSSCARCHCRSTACRAPCRMFLQNTGALLRTGARSTCSRATCSRARRPGLARCSPTTRSLRASRASDLPRRRRRSCSWPLRCCVRQSPQLWACAQVLIAVTVCRARARCRRPGPAVRVSHSLP